MTKSPSPAIEYAAPGLPRIFAAMVYDTLLLAAISIAYGAIVVALHVILVGQPVAGQHIQWGILSELMITLGWFAVLIVFTVYCWHSVGQTLGMKTWRIQIISANNYQLASYRQCLIRSLAALASLLILGMGYWYSLIHPQQRTFHDLVSGTQLILLKKK